MARNERVLCVAGLALFLLALLRGFFIPLFARSDAARAVHTTALESGTFLIAVGLLWPRLAFGPRPASVWGALLAASLYAITIGLTVGATYRVDDEHNHSVAASISMALNAGGGVGLIVALIAAALGFGGVAGTAATIAQVLFFVFLVLFVVSLFAGWGRRPAP